MRRGTRLNSSAVLFTSARFSALACFFLFAFCFLVFGISHPSSASALSGLLATSAARLLLLLDPPNIDDKTSAIVAKKRL